MSDGRENARKDSEIRVLIFWKMWLCIGRDDDENSTFNGQQNEITLSS